MLFCCNFEIPFGLLTFRGHHHQQQQPPSSNIHCYTILDRRFTNLTTAITSSRVAKFALAYTHIFFGALLGVFAGYFVSENTKNAYTRPEVQHFFLDVIYDKNEAPINPQKRLKNESILQGMFKKMNLGLEGLLSEIL